MSIKFFKREDFTKAAVEAMPKEDVPGLFKAGLFDGGPVKGKDALRDLLVKDGVAGDMLAKAVDETKDDEVSFPFVLSTNAPDRQGDVIDQAGWQLGNYRKNPVVLFGHDYGSLPVARASACYVAGDKLKAVDRFSDDHQLARECAALVSKGFLNAVSVGFRPIKWMWAEDRGMFAADFAECELLEHSVVPVPAHQDALIEARSAGIEVHAFTEWAEKCLASAGGIYLPRASIEKALLNAKGQKIIVDLGDRKSAPVVDAAPEPVEAPAAVEITIETALARVAKAGFAVVDRETLNRLTTPTKSEPAAAAVEPPAPAPAPAVEPPKVEPPPAPEPEVSISADEIKSLARAAFGSATDDVKGRLSSLQTKLTGRID